MNFTLEKLLTTSMKQKQNNNNDNYNTSENPKDKQQTGKNICNSYERQVLHSFICKELKVNKRKSNNLMENGQRIWTVHRKRNPNIDSPQLRVV